MARYFAPISKEELKRKVESAVEDLDVQGVVDYLRKDIKVNFNCENSEDEGLGLLGLHTLDNGLTFWGMQVGGDWEYPVFFIVYWDGKKLRGYVPTDGNPYNTDTKQAYGNFEEYHLEIDKGRKNPKHTDRLNCKKRYGRCPEDGDVGCWVEKDDSLMEKDIRKRILPEVN